MKKVYTLGLVAAVLQACSVGDQTVGTAPTTLQSRATIDQTIRQLARNSTEFRWAQTPDETLWSALHQSDGVLAVGYKPAGVSADLRETIHTIDIREPAWRQAREQLLDLIYAEERRLNPELERSGLEAYAETTLPVLDVRVRSLETVKKLRASGLVRYVEPMGYALNQTPDPDLGTLSSSGCGSNNPDPNDPLFAGIDFDNIGPNAKSSWHHPAHGIRDAWSSSTGAGVKIVIIDTGSSPSQDNLGSGFNQGNSTGRTIERLVTLPRAWPWSPAETPNDGCGHGTSMAGVAAGPRGTDGAAAGIAYNSSLITIRAATDVFLDASREIKGVADAYVLAANRADVRVISLSLGSISFHSQIADAVRYAFNRGKLMFCAGGTSFGWSSGWYGVVFPAYMDEVQAVTGVRDNVTQRCNNCHDGSTIDFTVVMEKGTNDRHIPTLAMSGDVPSTVGGSSVATATLSGMAALVWARSPGLSREQVVDRLARSSNFYPNRNGSLGWGRPNVNVALTTF